MKLPNGEQALIDPQKVLGHCLDPQHEDGRHKAHLFERLLGLNLNNADLLLTALELAAETSDATSGKLDEYGQRYLIDFRFAGPEGTRMMRSVWIIRHGESIPRLVTCYIL
jgi:hypothetical protein